MGDALILTRPGTTSRLPKRANMRRTAARWLFWHPHTVGKPSKEVNTLPKHYNIPVWFNGQYERAAGVISAETPKRFADAIEPDHEYLDCLRKRGRPWDLSLRELLLSGGPFRWSSEERNVGYNAIRIQNSYVLRSLLPSYMLAAVEIGDRGVSPAEEGVLPALLAERLTRASQDDEAFLAQFAGYRFEQIRLIKSVLDVVEMQRGEPSAEAARIAKTSFWQSIPGLVAVDAQVGAAFLES